MRRVIDKSVPHKRFGTYFMWNIWSTESIRLIINVDSKVEHTKRIFLDDTSGDGLNVGSLFINLDTLGAAIEQILAAS